MRVSLSKRLLSLTLSCLSFSSFSQQSDSAQIDVPRIQTEITIDGKLDEAAWQQARQVSLNFVTRPDENTTPPVNTTAYVFEDGEILYVGFDAQDNDIERLSAFFRDRDRAWSDDLVGIKIDAFNDRRLAYQFFVNPLGVQLDSIENEMTKRESDSWDGIWDAAGEVGENGYVVEMALPLRMMNFNENTEALTWAVEFVRYYPRDVRYRISNMPVDRNDSCDLCQMGEMTGFAGAKQGENLAIVPSLVTAYGETRDVEEGTDWDSDTNIEPGLDVKWGITPDTSLIATLNPDFSQVEADVAQLSVNNTFSLFFPEKRAFFLENQDYFSTNYNLVYTRNIASPDYGGKYTGRIGQQTFGLFVANDAETSFIVPGNRGSSLAEVDDKSTNAALRYRYDFSDDLSLGWISTLRSADDYHNYVNGIDGKWRMTQNDTLRVQVIHTDTEYPEDLYEQFCDVVEDDDGNEIENCDMPDETACEFGDCTFNEAVLRTQKDGSFSDIGYRVDLEHDERDWFMDFRHQFRGEDFRTDLGFIPTSDFEKTVLGGGYRWYNETSWWNKVTLSGDWDITHNDAGDLIERELEGYVHVDAIKQSYFRFGGGQRERVGLRHDASNLDIAGNTTKFDETFIQTFFEMRPSASVYWNVNIKVAEEIDFANNRLGDVIRVRPVLNINPTEHIQMRIRHTYNEMEVDNELLFRANLTDFRFTYQFDVRSFLRLSLIYSDIERNQNNYLYDDVTESSVNLSSQLLYSYKINPYTLFFLGYSDAYLENDDISSLKQDERSVFMKLSYAWLQ